MVGERVGIVACCKQKLNGYTWAKDLYQSLLFKLSRLYVEKVCDRWVILSAKHGVVMPEQCLWRYDVELSKLTKKQRFLWATQTHEELFFHFVPHVQFVVLAGAEYSKCIPPDDRKLQVKSYYPLEGMGIGQRLSYLKQTVGKKALLTLQGIDPDIPF